jgi:hypothetical protein
MFERRVNSAEALWPVLRQLVSRDGLGRSSFCKNAAHRMDGRDFINMATTGGIVHEIGPGNLDPPCW